VFVLATPAAVGDAKGNDSLTFRYLYKKLLIWLKGRQWIVAVLIAFDTDLDGGTGFQRSG